MALAAGSVTYNLMIYINGVSGFNRCFLRVPCQKLVQSDRATAKVIRAAKPARY